MAEDEALQALHVQTWDQLLAAVQEVASGLREVGLPLTAAEVGEDKLVRRQVWLLVPAVDQWPSKRPVLRQVQRRRRQTIRVVEGTGTESEQAW